MNVRVCVRAHEKNECSFEVKNFHSTIMLELWSVTELRINSCVI